MADSPTTLRPTPDVLPADRLRNLIDRACRHLTPAEANALRGALAGTMRNATTAVEGLHQRAADAEDDRDRARRWAVALENENRRLEDQAKEAKERARVAVVAAYNLKRQTPDAAQRTLDRVRQARTWCDLWVQLGMYYGLKPEECGLEARDRRTTAERTAEARAERAEQQAAHVRAVLAEVLAQFTHNTHPGRPCKQTGHVNVATIDRWHAALDAAGQPDTEPAREDGHTGACDATEPTGAPEPDETRNGRHTPVQDLEQWSAIINTETDPDEAAAKLLALRDRGQQQLRAELAQAAADIGHRDQTIRHLENGLRHERQALADARNYLNQVPAHHINSQVRADLQRRLDARR